MPPSEPTPDGAPDPAPTHPETPQTPAGRASGDDSAASTNGTAPTPSALDVLREKHASITVDRRVELAIPGYGDLLFARYRPVPYREIKAARKKASRRGDDPEAEVNFAARVLMDACETILYRDDPGDDLVPLHTRVESFGDEPVKFDPRLLKAVGVDDPPARPIDVVRLVFKNTYAVVSHFNEYEAWLRGNEDDADF